MRRCIQPHSFATFLIVGSTCFFLGVLFSLLPYDYYILWAMPTKENLASAPKLKHLVSSVKPIDYYLDVQESHLRFLHASPPLVPRILHMVMGTGILGFLVKLYKPSESNMLFDGASLVLYLIGLVIYLTNIIQGLRVVSIGIYDGKPINRTGSTLLPTGPSLSELTSSTSLSSLSPSSTPYSSSTPLNAPEYFGRRDSLLIMAASNTILAVLLIGILVLQTGQWYAARKEEIELEQIQQASCGSMAGKPSHHDHSSSCHDHSTQLTSNSSRARSSPTTVGSSALTSSHSSTSGSLNPASHSRRRRG